ncbi:M20 family metallo-hydrolase [Natranaerobius trueperi]|uniref:Zn-dependent hydrolase n=1 Tax=Natranaerobius trueperi TaxID=759412 RepID=A0A226BZH3_9FIRM|nr:M20 family metallo-hydrolase [Natranaerobius trueperi]OWZ84321.1 Zn-dependent hydrolase [Natranaerobius trueperi]
MRVSKERIERDLKKLNQFNANIKEPGTTRLPFTPEEDKCRKQLIKDFEDAGLEVYQDSIGNIFGRREGTDSNASPVMIGSHIDTVINGGMFDGNAGVIAGLEVVRTLNEYNITTEKPIEVAIFIIEESTAYGKSCVGSRAVSGTLEYEELSKLVDKNGVSLEKAFKDRGIRKEEVLNAKKSSDDIDCYLELHIEQADNLIKAQKPVGIITAIAAATRFKVKLTGKAAHSGAAPMGERQDALCAASEIILGIENIAYNEAGEHTVGTVGSIEVLPGAVNVVPGEAELMIDLRDIEKDTKDKATEQIKQLIEKVCKNREIEVDYEITACDDPVPTSNHVFETMKDASDELNMSTKIMHSAAAHDAAYIAKITDMGMIFIRSYGGSHNPEEWAEFLDIAKGTELLLETTIRLANKL